MSPRTSNDNSNSSDTSNNKFATDQTAFPADGLFSKASKGNGIGATGSKNPHAY